MSIKPLPNGSFPVVFLPLEYRIGQKALFAVCNFNRFHAFGSAFGFIRDRPRFPVLVLTNDFADAGFVLIGNRFQATVLHEVAEIIQRMIIAGQIIEVAQSSRFGIVMLHNFNVRQVEESSPVNGLKFSVWFLLDNALCKHKMLNLFRVRNRERHLIIKGARLAPFTVFHFAALDLLASADANIIAQESDFF